jgi:chromate transporter
MVTVPFLFELSNKYSWFTSQELIYMIAVSESSPGPIGVNMATYGGFLASGVSGALCATLGLITPALIIVCLLAHIWKKINQSPSVISTFNAVKASVAGLLFGIFLTMILPLISHSIISLQNLKVIAIFGISLILTRIKNLSVFVIILVSASLGILLGS